MNFIDSKFIVVALTFLVWSVISNAVATDAGALDPPFRARIIVSRIFVSKIVLVYQGKHANFKTLKYFELSLNSYSLHQAESKRCEQNRNSARRHAMVLALTTVSVAKLSRMVIFAF